MFLQMRQQITSYLVSKKEAGFKSQAFNHHPCTSEGRNVVFFPSFIWDFFESLGLLTPRFSSGGKHGPSLTVGDFSPSLHSSL
jgi:hypothetical protein